MDGSYTNNAESPNSRAARVGKLLPKSLATRRWKKQPSRESFVSSGSSEDAPRGRSPHGREQLLSGDSASATSMSQPATDMVEEEEEDEERVDRRLGGRSGSPGADASDSELSTLRPTFPSTHPSQIGHLTTSSPVIQAEHAPEVQQVDELAHESQPGLARSATYSVSVASHASPDPASQPSANKPGLLPTPGFTARRSKSPSGRFKDVFKAKRSATSSFDEVPESQEDPTGAASETFTRPATSSGAQTDHQPLASTPDTNAPRVVPPEPLHRLRTSTTTVDSSRRPQTPPSQETPAPVIVNTPPTPTEHSKPRFDDRPASAGNAETSASDLSSSNVATSSSSGKIAHRRGRSRSGSTSSIGPSKLSNITAAPLTPTPENAVPQTPGAGFFSSVLSAAQNAANTFSSTVNTTNIGLGGRPKTPIPSESQEGDGDTTEVESSTAQTATSAMAEPAVKTMGNGDLSLSQLGIQENPPASQVSRFSEQHGDSRNRSESAPDPPGSSQPTLGTDDSALSRPKSAYDSVSDRTPPTSLYDGKSGVHRSGSMRSAIGRRRKRGSTGGTANTTGTVGAAIAAANASVAHPIAAGSTPKLTGFAVASKKRNRDFHSLFKSVPDDDYLIEDYSCALQREILAHGRLYVSEGHLCFSSNILGWVTTLVMSFDEIVSVEKRSTALVFKNGLMISTLHAKHVFASFTSRDSTYDLIVNIWKLGHPTLRSSLNGVCLEDTGGDKTEKVDDLDPAPDNSGSGSEIYDEESEDGEDEIYDEDEDEDDQSVGRANEVPAPDTEAEKTATRKVSGGLAANGASEKPKDGAPAPAGGNDFPGPAAHAPTECTDGASHFERALADEIIAAPLGKVYNLVFGPASVNFMAKWLTNDQKCFDLQLEDKIGLTQDNKSRAYTYIKPLNASIGPKQTKCIVNETVENLDLEKAVSVLVVVQNPDVPSGNIFSVKTKYCLSWAENNATRMQVNCTIEWTGKSWLKGPIEKGANDGQIQYCKDLCASLRSATTSRPSNVNGAPGGGRGKKKKNKKLQQASKESLDASTELSRQESQNWGVFEPVHGILSPVLDILKPILTGNVVYGLLVGLLVASWFGFGSRQNGPAYGHGLGFPSHPDRLIAYEELWRREESDLWDWLEERVGLHRMSDGGMPDRKHVVEPRTVQDRLREDRMTEREVEEAIRITEEKLQVLRQAHDRRKPKGPEKSYSRPTTQAAADL